MKVLFDCILTARPSRCSTNIQFVTLANELVKNPHVYVYWPIPTAIDEWMADGEREWYPKHPQIRYIEMPQYKDRMKEYNRIHPVLEDLLSFNGDTWDWDVLVTVRAPMVAIMRTVCTSPRQLSRLWTKRIYIIEDMMVMSVKPTVAKSNPEVQDRLTLEGYLAADKVLMPAYHQKDRMLGVAKTHFTPANVIKLRKNVEEVCHLNMPDYRLKDPQFRYTKDRKLKIAFVGRMELSAARLTSINMILRDLWIMHSDKVYPFVCTVSEGHKLIDPTIVDIRHPMREEFWKICREEMDLGVYFHVDPELNMSMLEPVAFGVPVIAIRAPWSEASLGVDYPFLVSSETQAYGLALAFQENYEKYYEQFSVWHKAWFQPTYTERTETQGLYSRLLELILTPTPPEEQEGMEQFTQNDVVRLLAENGGDEFVMKDLIISLGGTELRSLAQKMKKVDDRETRSLVFATPWNEFRLAMKMFHGYEDASAKTGHLKKVV